MKVKDIKTCDMCLRVMVINADRLGLFPVSTITVDPVDGPIREYILCPDCISKVEGVISNV